MSLHHLARDHAIYNHALHRYLLARGRNAKEFAAMSAMPRKAAKYLLPFPHHLFDDPMNVGKRSAKRANHLLKTLAPLLLARKRLNFHEINGHEIVNSLKLALIEDFLNETADHCFILLWCHEILSFSAKFGNSVNLQSARRIHLEGLIVSMPASFGGQ